MPRKINKDRPINYYEKQFAKAIVKTKGSKRKAAMIAYNTSTPDSASQIGNEVFKRPQVQAEIERLLDDAGLSKEAVVADFRATIKAGIGKGARNSDSVRGLIEMAKLHDMYPSQKKEIRKVNISVELSGKTPQELLEELGKMHEEVKTYVPIPGEVIGEVV